MMFACNDIVKYSNSDLYCVYKVVHIGRMMLYCIFSINVLCNSFSPFLFVYVCFLCILCFGESIRKCVVRHSKLLASAPFFLVIRVKVLCVFVGIVLLCNQIKSLILSLYILCCVCAGHASCCGSVQRNQSLRVPTS